MLLQELAAEPAARLGVTASGVRDQCGRSLLAMAAWKGHVSTVEMLCTEWKAVASRSATGDRSGAEAEEAAARRKLELSVWRVDIDARFGPFNNTDGWTAFAIAAYMGHGGVVEALRRHGANPLLGTTFFKDAFQLTEVIRDNPLRPSGALGGCMQEALENGAAGRMLLMDQSKHLLAIQVVLGAAPCTSTSSRCCAAICARARLHACRHAHAE